MLACSAVSTAGPVKGECLSQAASRDKSYTCLFVTSEIGSVCVLLIPPTTEKLWVGQALLRRAYELFKQWNAFYKSLKQLIFFGKRQCLYNSSDLSEIYVGS